MPTPQLYGTATEGWGSHSEFGRGGRIGNGQHQKWTLIPQNLLGHYRPWVCGSEISLLGDDKVKLSHYQQANSVAFSINAHKHIMELRYYQAVSDWETQEYPILGVPCSALDPSLHLPARSLRRYLPKGSKAKRLFIIIWGLDCNLLIQ